MKTVNANFGYIIKFVGESPYKEQKVYLIHIPTGCVVTILEKVAQVKEAVKVFESAAWQIVQHECSDVFFAELQDEFEYRGNVEVYEKPAARLMRNTGTWYYETYLKRIKYSGLAVEFKHSPTNKSYHWVFLKGSC